MKVLLLIFIFILSSCCTNSNIIKYTPSPNIYRPMRATNEQQVYREYMNATIKITEWQQWYNLNISNIYHISNKKDLKSNY